MERKERSRKMNIDIVTTEDLRQFREELLKEIRMLRQPNEMHNDRKWLRSAQVRKLLHISPGTLQNLRITGVLPYRKIGGSMYYRREDIDNMMEGGGK